MKANKILVAVLLVCIVVVGAILTIYFWNRQPEQLQENEPFPGASQSSEQGNTQTGGAQPEVTDGTQQENQMEEFAKYIDFSQDGKGEIQENGEYINKKYHFIMHVPEVWKGNYRTDVLDMTNGDAVVAYFSFMFTYKGNEELLGKIVIADEQTWETWEKSQMMTMPEVIARSSDKNIIYGIDVVDSNPLEEGSDAYEKFEAMRIKDAQMAKELFALTNE